jgi:UDP-N-acetylglucosamine acyltransferase
MALSPRIHPTALISPESELADNVQVGPHVVLEGAVRIGPGCVLKPFVHLIGPLTMGCNNTIFSGCVIGEQPQHMRYSGEPTSTEIGDNNVFREHVTIHRGTTQSWTTRIGSGNFFMAHSHVAHDCNIGNQCILANGALLGGHCVLENGVYLSGNCAVHQFVRMGRLSLLSGVSGATKDVPPFVIQQHINCVVGVNVVGMRRAGISHADIDAVRQAYHLVYRQGLTLPNALQQVEQELGQVAVAMEMASFIRRSTRGISLVTTHGRHEAA